MSWQFLHPGRLWLLLLLVVLVAAVVLGAAQRRRRAVRFTNLDLLASVAPARSDWTRHLVSTLVVFGFAVGILALAQPYREERVAGERSIIMVVLDVSLSMMATDVEPSRLDAAKDQAVTFVEGVDDSIDIGLVSFSQRVRLRVSPTLDRDEVIDEIVGFELEEGTAIGDAIAEATDVIVDEFELPSDPADSSDSSDEDPGELGEGGPPAAIVILTDGETVPGLTPGPEGAAEAARRGIPVYGIAFGTPEGSITLDDPVTGEPTTQPVPVKYEELTEAADLTGGEFYAAETGGDLGQVYDDIEQQLEPALEVPEPERVELTVRYLAAALLLLAAAFVAAQLTQGGLA